MVTKVKDAIKFAMKAKDQQTLTVLRDLTNSANMIAKNSNREVTNDDYMSAVTKGIKTREESLKIYTDANRLDLAEKESFEIEVLKKYLPKMLGEDELTLKIKEVITLLGASTKKDMGNVMKNLPNHLEAGSYDKGLASKIVGTLLN